MKILYTLIVVAFLGVTQPGRAQSDSAPTAADLARTLRTLLIPNLPDPLVQQTFDWGKQSPAPAAVDWKKKGLLYRPEIRKELRNDGHWRKVVVTADNPRDSVRLDVSRIHVPEAGRLTFHIAMEMPIRIRFEQQVWTLGMKMYSGETRARCKAAVHLDCESTSRFERPPGSLLPELVFRLRVVDAKISYHDLVVEHTAGLGGDAAKLIGNVAHDALRQWRPSLERNLLEKANAAIVKAGDTKEVRLGLGKLLDSKK